MGNDKTTCFIKKSTAEKARKLGEKLGHYYMRESIQWLLERALLIIENHGVEVFIEISKEEK